MGVSVPCIYWRLADPCKNIVNMMLASVLKMLCKKLTFTIADRVATKSIFLKVYEIQKLIFDFDENFT